MSQDKILLCPFCGEPPTFNEHFKEKGLFNMIHRCSVLGGIAWDWSNYERLVARWNIRFTQDKDEQKPERTI